MTTPAPMSHEEQARALAVGIWNALRAKLHPFYQPLGDSDESKIRVIEQSLSIALAAVEQRVWEEANMTAPLSREQVQSNIDYVAQYAASGECWMGCSANLMAHDAALRTRVKELETAQQGVYKNKHAYQWHDEYAMTLKAWHEEVDALKQQLATVTAERDRSANPIEHADYFVPQFIALEQQLAERDARIAEMQKDCFEHTQDHARAQLKVNEQRARIKRLKEALGPFSSGGEWGKWKAWIVEGSPLREQGIAAARIITRCQVTVDEALAKEETP